MARGEHSESFRTFTGRYVWPLDPRPEDIDLADVAHALARINRFNGHTAKPYSVAEHAVRVSRLVEALAWADQCNAPHAPDCRPMGDMEGNCSCGSTFARRNWRRLSLWGLHHDDSEYLLVDFPRPMKRSAGVLSTAYREAEGRLMACVCQHFGLPVVQPYLVDMADKAMLLVEQRDLMNAAIPDRDSYPAFYEIAQRLPELHPWGYERAEQAYLQRQCELTGRNVADGVRNGR